MTQQESRIAKLIASCATKPHGERARYMAGCRCLPCRAAHARYNADCERRIRNGITNKLVPADRAREHLVNLSRKGIGRHAVRAATDIAESILHQITQGRRLHICEAAERRILAVDESVRSDHSLMDARTIWKLLDELIDRGYSRAQLARWLGKRSPALQISRGKMLAVQGLQIQRLYARLQAGLLRRDTAVRFRKVS
jgi:hypothetical protein